MLDQKGMDRNLRCLVADLVDGTGAVSSVPFYPSLVSSLVASDPFHPWTNIFQRRLPARSNEWAK